MLWLSANFLCLKLSQSILNALPEIIRYISPRLDVGVGIKQAELKTSYFPPATSSLWPEWVPYQPNILTDYKYWLRKLIALDSVVKKKKQKAEGSKAAPAFIKGLTWETRRA